VIYIVLLYFKAS